MRTAQQLSFWTKATPSSDCVGNISSKRPFGHVFDNLNRLSYSIDSRFLKIPKFSTSTRTTSWNDFKLSQILGLKLSKNHPKQYQTVVVISALIAAVGSFSFYIRKIRSDIIQALPFADQYFNNDEKELRNLIHIVERMGLMGKSSSVKEELDDIRHWHIQNGYKGGLVLCDITQPIYGNTDNSNIKNNDDPSILNVSSKEQNPKQIQKQKILNQRECYYLYYEMKPNGIIVQQIFCRGTTIWDDFLTCLQWWMIYDDDCQCYVHRGFRNHAERILHDVMPLLISPSLSSRSTVEVYGHSLGGAVGSILAIKLRKLGYNVIRLTTVGQPRFIFWLGNETRQENERIMSLLPKHHLRIEHEYDFVTYLPPFGSKIDSATIYITSKHGVRYVSNHTKSNLVSSMRYLPTWTQDSILWNFFLPEVFTSKGLTHRIPSYLNSLKAISVTKA